MSKTQTANAKRKLNAIARRLDDARGLLYEVGDLLPEDKRIGLQDAVDSLVQTQQRIKRATETAGKTFEELYPEPAAETVYDRIERQNAEALARM